MCHNCGNADELFVSDEDLPGGIRAYVDEATLLTWPGDSMVFSLPLGTPEDVVLQAQTAVNLAFWQGVGTGRYEALVKAGILPARNTVGGVA